MPQKAKISGFSIPRLQSGEKSEGELTSKPLDSRDAKELFDEIQRKIHDHKCYSEWHPASEVQFVHSRTLETAFRDKKAVMKSEAPPGAKDVQETVAFALCSETEAKAISTKGLCCGNGTTNALGNRTMGVYLFRCIDVCLRVAAFKLGAKAQVTLMAFKVALGKVKPVTLRAANDESFEPTPLFDCHVSQARPASNEKFVSVIPKTMMFVYEFDDDCLPVQRPRQCLPHAILTFTWKPPSTPSPAFPVTTPPPLPNNASSIGGPPAPPPPTTAAGLAAKNSPQPNASASPSGGFLSPPLSSPDRTALGIDPRRSGAVSLPRRGILKGQAFQNPSSSPSAVQASHSSGTLTSPMMDDAQFSPNQDADDFNQSCEQPRGPTIIPKYAPDHPKYKPWVEHMQKLGYRVEDFSARRHRSGAAKKRRSANSKPPQESRGAADVANAANASSEEEEGKERLQIKEMIMQKVGEMKAQAKSTQPENVLDKLEVMNSIVPELINGLAASISSTGVDVNAELLVEDRFRAKLTEIMDSLKTNIVASNYGNEDGEGGGEATSTTTGEGNGGDNGDDVTVIEDSEGESSEPSSILNTVVKDVSSEEFRQLDKAIHKHYCLYYAEYSRLKEMRKIPEESNKEEMEAMENDIAKIQIEIEFLKHRVSQHRWPSELYLTPKDILLKGEEKRVLRYPISEYQVCKVKEINRYIYKHYKNRTAAGASKDYKAVEKIQRELSRFKKDRELTLNDVNMVPNMSSFSPGYDFDIVTRVREVLIANGPIKETKELFEKKLHFLEGKVATLKLKKDKEINIVRQPPASSADSGSGVDNNHEKSVSPLPEITPENADAATAGQQKGTDIQKPLSVSEEEEVVREESVAWASPSVPVTEKNRNPSIGEVPAFYTEAAVTTTTTPALTTTANSSAEPKSILKNANAANYTSGANAHDAIMTEEDDVEIFDEAPASPDCLSDHDSGFEAPPELESEVPPSNAVGGGAAAPVAAAAAAPVAAAAAAAAALAATPETAGSLPVQHTAPESTNFTYFFNRLADSLSEVFTDMNAQPTTTTPLPSNARAAFTAKIAAVISECGMENLRHLEAMSRLQGGGDLNLPNAQTNPVQTDRVVARDEDEPPLKKAKETSSASNGVASSSQQKNHDHLPPIPPPPIPPMLLPTISLLSKTPGFQPVQTQRQEDQPQPSPKPPVPPPPVIIPVSTTAYDPPSPPFFPSSSSVSSATENPDDSSPVLDTDIRFLPCLADRDERNGQRPDDVDNDDQLGNDNDVDERISPSVATSEMDANRKNASSPTISLDSSDKDVVNVSQTESVIILSAPASPTYSDDGIQPVLGPTTTDDADEADSDRDVDLRVVETFQRNASAKKRCVSSSSSSSAPKDVDLRDTAVEIVDMELSSDEEENAVNSSAQTTATTPTKNLTTSTATTTPARSMACESVICLDDDNDDNLQIVIDGDDRNSEMSGPSSARTVPPVVEAEEIASPSSPPVVMINDDYDKGEESERDEVEEEGEISFDEDGGVIVGLDKNSTGDSFKKIDADSHHLYRSYEELYRRYCYFLDKRKERSLSNAEDREFIDVELKLADLFFKHKEMKLNFEPSLFSVDEEYLKVALRLPEEEENDVRLSIPLGKWQEEELTRLKKDIVEVKEKMTELILLDEFPLNLANVLVNLKMERAKILGKDKSPYNFLVPPLKFKPTNAALRRLSLTYPDGDRRKRMIEDELLARVTIEKSKISPMSYKEFLLLQDTARSVFKKLVSIDDGGRHSFQVDKMFYRHVQLANLKKKYASLCTLEEENGKTDVFDKEIPRGVPGPLSLKGDVIRNRPLSDWQLDALEAMKSQVEDLRGCWSRLNKSQKRDEKGRKMIRALESFLHLRRFVISDVILVPNLPSVLSSDVKEQPEMHLCGLLNDVLAGDESSNLDSLQIYESMMAIITEASDGSTDQGNGQEWHWALEKLCELMFWDEMPENKELFFIKDSLRRHETFYNKLPFHLSNLGSSHENSSSSDSRAGPSSGRGGSSERGGGEDRGIDERSGEDAGVKVSDRVGTGVGRASMSNIGRGNASKERTGNALSLGVVTSGRTGVEIGKMSQPPRLLDLKLDKPVNKRLSSSDDEDPESRLRLSANDRDIRCNPSNSFRSNFAPINPMMSPPLMGQRNSSPPRPKEPGRWRSDRLSLDAPRGPLARNDAESPRSQPDQRQRDPAWAGDRSRLPSDSSSASSSPNERGKVVPGRGILGSCPDGLTPMDNQPRPMVPHHSTFNENLIRAAGNAMNSMRMALMNQNRFVGGRGILGEGPRMGPGMNGGNPRDGFGMRMPGNLRMPNGGFRGIRRF